MRKRGIVDVRIVLVSMLHFTYVTFFWEEILLGSYDGDMGAGRHTGRSWGVRHGLLIQSDNTGER